MKSYILQSIRDEQRIKAALSTALPGQSNPWLLLVAPNDPIAFFYIMENDTDAIHPAISADISGRHYDSDKLVLKVLELIQADIGGDITSDA